MIVFLAAMAELGEYHTGGYDQIRIYRDKSDAQLKKHTKLK